jgi:hypothetical protein
MWGDHDALCTRPVTAVKPAEYSHPRFWFLVIRSTDSSEFLVFSLFQAVTRLMHATRLPQKDNNETILVFPGLLSTVNSVISCTVRWDPEMFQRLAQGPRAMKTCERWALIITCTRL